MYISRIMDLQRLRGSINDTTLGIVAVIAVAACAWFATTSAADKVVVLPAPAYDLPSQRPQETAVLLKNLFERWTSRQQRDCA